MSTPFKLKVKEIVVKDKIYFYKKDIEVDFEHFKVQFIHRNQDTYYTTLKEYDNDLCSLPSNAWWKLSCDNIIDKRNYPKRELLEFKAKLRSNQEKPSQSFLKTKSGIARSGLLQAECGWGKTFVGSYLISKIPTNSLVLVHTKLLFRQWEEELYKQTSVKKVGLIGDGIYDPQNVTVGIYLSVKNNLSKLENTFGFINVDECHRAPAATFSEVVNNLNARIKMGMTATPWRTDGKHIILPEYFTNFKVVGESPPEVENIYFNVHQVPYDFIYRDPKKDRAKILTKIGGNLKYHEEIASIATQDIIQGRCILILSDRIEMLNNLKKILPRSVLLIGKTSDDEREEIIKKAGIKYDVILSTTIFDEGISCHRLDTIYLTCPTSNLYKTEQRIGRIKREHPNKRDPLIRDFWFRGDKVAAQQEKRLRWYIGKGFKEWN